MPPFNQANNFNPRGNSPTTLGILEGARDFEIKNSVLTNVQGNALMFRFDGPPTEEFKNLITQHMEGLITIKDLDRIAMTIKEHGLSQAIRDLPRARAAYNDYTSSKRRRTACFKNTRQALLKEIALCVTSTDGPRAYVLFGIAGIGKSTVAQTVAEKADTLRLLGASFFFSRDEADRRTAEKFFTSIAFQLCAYDKQFSDAIGAVLTKERGAAATSKDPQEQLAVLILEPLRDIDRSRSLPTVIVVDALDECDVDDGPIVLMALSQLVQELPSFRVVLTTRPQPHLQYLLDRLGAHQVFRMEDIEQKVVEDDIRLYLEYSLSPDQVHTRLPMLRGKWAANDEEINSLVKAAGGLFIIASTAVLFILDITAYNPASRTKTLRDGFSRNLTPFNTLNDFYTVILRTAVPLNCESDIVERYQSVVGAIVLIEDPLPVGALANLINMSEDDVCAALAHLQSVISLGSNDIPLVYHKSFPDYVTDDQRCKDTDLHIAPRYHHTRLATCCLHIMNVHLKRNILGLGAVSQYLDNEKALEEEQLSWDSVQQAIPSELQYASVHWAKHVAQADLNHTELMTELKTFAEKHLLYWLEGLSWLRKLNMAHVPLVIALKLQALNSNVRQIFSDALRFIAKDYEKITQSASYIYRNALPFTPIETALYKRYKRQLSLCQVEGGPAQWDIHVSEKQHGYNNRLHRLAFAKDNSQFASWDKHNVKLWDSASGTPIKTFDGDGIVLADDFSVLAVPQGNSVTMYSVSSSAPITSFNHPSTVVTTAISFDGSQLAVGLEDGTVRVLDVAKKVSSASFDNYSGGLLAFSPHGYMLAFDSMDGINLLDGVSLVARLGHELEVPVKIAFSSDGTRLVTLTKKDDAYSLWLWNGADGDFIAGVSDVGYRLAVSVDGSFIATGGGKKVQVWSGDSLALAGTIPITNIWDLAFSGDILAIPNLEVSILELYDVKRKACIAAVPIPYPVSLASSPDATRLAVGGVHGKVNLLDVLSISASPATPEQKLSAVTALALSRDGSRLASGHGNGSVKLWDTSNMRQAIACRNQQSNSVTPLAFSPDGNQLAFGSKHRTVIFWDGRNGSPIGVLDEYRQHWIALAFSSSLLATGTADIIMLWDRTSLSLIHVFEQGGYQLSFSLDGSALVSIFNDADSNDTNSNDANSTDSNDANSSGADSDDTESNDANPDSDSDDSDSDVVSKVTVWDTGNFTEAATFVVYGPIRMLFPSPDGSRLILQCLSFDFKFFDVATKEVISNPENRDFSWVPHLNGIPTSWNYRYYNKGSLVGRVSASHDRVPILQAPHGFYVRAFASQSSTFALGCDKGRILIIRPPACR